MIENILWFAFGSGVASASIVVLSALLAMRHAEHEPEAPHKGRHLFAKGPVCLYSGCSATNRRFKREDPRELAVAGEYPNLPERG